MHLANKPEGVGRRLQRQDDEKSGHRYDQSQDTHEGDELADLMCPRVGQPLDNRDGCRGTLQRLQQRKQHTQSADAVAERLVATSLKHDPAKCGNDHSKEERQNYVDDNRAEREFAGYTRERR